MQIFVWIEDTKEAHSPGLSMVLTATQQSKWFSLFLWLKIDFWPLKLATDSPAFYHFQMWIRDSHESPTEGQRLMGNGISPKATGIKGGLGRDSIGGKYCARFHGFFFTQVLQEMGRKYLLNGSKWHASKDHFRIRVAVAASAMILGCNGSNGRIANDIYHIWKRSFMANNMAI